MLSWFKEIFNFKEKQKKFDQRLATLESLETDESNLFKNLYLQLNALKSDSFDVEELFKKKIRPLNIVFLDSNNSYIDYLFPNLVGTFDNTAPQDIEPNFFYICGIGVSRLHSHIIATAMKVNEKVYVFEDAFFRSIFSYTYLNIEKKYQKSLGFTIDDITHYVDAGLPSRLEQMLNDKKLTITDEQQKRARKCIDIILETHLSKYNNQPIFEPQIGRKGVKKILVLDQSYKDWSVTKGKGSYALFQEMLEQAIYENPDADIIIKTHPDKHSGRKGGYYDKLIPPQNVYIMKEPVNPISLAKICDKVYVCTSQFGFEALMCGKEVHVFGIPFYAGWGLTQDRQKCERRTNTRNLEEMFYIAYIMYSHYVNPDKKCRCEIEEAMEYLLKLREEYFESVKE